MPLASINGTRIHYQVIGEGTPILFIHPPLLTSSNFAYQRAKLSMRYQIITFDIRGHGRSRFSPQPLTYALIVRDMKGLLDHLGIQQVYLCGYSAGGSIALEFMLTYPDRCLGSVLISTMPAVKDRRLRSRIKWALQACRFKAERFLALSICFGNADCRATFRNLYLSAREGSARNWRQYYKHSLKYDCIAKLKRIDHPVLIINGEKDRGFRRYAQTLFRELPNSEVQFVPNVAHQIPTKAGFELNERMADWIARMETKQAELQQETWKEEDIEKWTDERDSKWTDERGEWTEAWTEAHEKRTEPQSE